MDRPGTSNMAGVIEKPEFRSTFSEGTDILIGLYITTVGLLSVTANIVVLWGTFKQKQGIADMDIITINISLCQIAPAIISYPLVLVSAFSHGWHFSQLDCERDGFFIYFFAMTTIGLLLLMTFYRYIRMYHRHLFTRQNASQVRLMVFAGLGASYLYGLMWALPPLLGYGAYILEPHNMACSLNWTSLPLPYTLGILVLGYLLPVSTMVGIYGRILVSVRSSCQQVATCANSTYRKVYHVTIVSILHCACFLLVWTPYAVLSFITIFSVTVPNSLYVTSSFFAKVDTLINPFVFFVIRKKVIGSSSSRKVTQDRVRVPILNKKKASQDEQPELDGAVSTV